METQVHFNNRYDEKLVGTIHLPDGPSDSGVVFGHCFTCSRHTTILRQLCTGLAGENFIALRFDFSGNGQSEGVFAESTYSKQVSEMQSAVDLIAEKGARWIGLGGHSMGAVIAVLAASRLPVARSVCALAGRLSGLNAANFLNPSQAKELQSTGRVSFSSRGRSLELSDVFFADAAQYDLPEAVSALKPPLIVVHGDQDEIIPVQEAYQAQRMNPDGTTLAVIPGADHMFSRAEHRDLAVRLAVDWFKAQRSGGQASVKS